MWQIIEGDCRHVLPTLETASVQCCVTSPPYWQLRDYGTTNQLGVEDTPEEFVDNLVGVFREVRRILKEDGVLWLNLGDTFCGGGGYCPNAPSNRAGSKQSTSRGVKPKPRPVPPTYKPKDLVGLPWLVAHALRRDGWYLRADVIWERPNSMPEKVTDRPVRGHEYVFLLAKGRHYHFDHLALQEPAKDGGVRNGRCVWRIPQQAFPGVHYAVFPEDLVRRCVLPATRPGDVVLDPFAGSGTTGVVAKKLGRGFIGVEGNYEYCATARARIDATPGGFS